MRLTVDLRNVTLEEALEATLSCTGFTYRIEGHVLYVWDPDRPGQAPEIPSAPKPAPVPKRETAQLIVLVPQTKPGLRRVYLRNADLASVLQLIGRGLKKKIATSRAVEGVSVTADLYDVTYEEALEAVLHHNGFVSRTKDGAIYVYSP